MILKIFGSLTAAYFVTMIGGLFNAFIESAIFYSYFRNRTDEIFIAGFIIAILLPGLIETFLFLPLTFGDKKTILQLSFKNLLKRYLPFIVLPFAVIVITMVLTICNDKGDIELFMILACHAYLISITALVVFLKMIKL